MMTTETAQETPAVWIGCLGCYNAGALVGDWYEAIDADTVTLADVHRGSGRSYALCEELWCLDHEGLPVSGEMSPLDAAAWAQRLEEIDEHLRPALYAWVRSGNYIAEGTGDLPCIGDFVDRFSGEWDSFDEYAQQLAEDIGLLDGVAEEIARYFDWEAWTRDLAFDYTVEDAPGGGVFVFQSH